MGRGDKKTRKAKILADSYGKKIHHKISPKLTPKKKKK